MVPPLKLPLLMPNTTYEQTQDFYRNLVSSCFEPVQPGEEALVMSLPDIAQQIKEKEISLAEWQHPYIEAALLELDFTPENYGEVGLPYTAWWVKYKETPREEDQVTISLAQHETEELEHCNNCGRELKREEYKHCDECIIHTHQSLEEIESFKLTKEAVADLMNDPSGTRIKQEYNEALKLAMAIKLEHGDLSRNRLTIQFDLSEVTENPQKIYEYANTIYEGLRETLDNLLSEKFYNIYNKIK